MKTCISGCSSGSRPMSPRGLALPRDAGHVRPLPGAGPRRRHVAAVAPAVAIVADARRAGGHGAYGPRRVRRRARIGFIGIRRSLMRPDEEVAARANTEGGHRPAGTSHADAPGTRTGVRLRVADGRAAVAALRAARPVRRHDPRRARLVLEPGQPHRSSRVHRSRSRSWRATARRSTGRSPSSS